MSGIHHVTAIAGKARRNFDFYTRTLGLRLVKKTVNFDDPGTYHFYYGDEAGQPGTILTFFPWEHAAPGRGGVGQTHQTAFRVPVSSLGWWTGRQPSEALSTPDVPERFLEGQALVWQARIGAAAVCETCLVQENGINLLAPVEDWPIRRYVIQGTRFDLPDLLIRDPST